MPEKIVSAVVPARNEEATVAAAVESLAAQTVPLEILVVNDGSADRTRAILLELQTKIATLRVIENNQLPPGWTGKNYAVSVGAAQAHTPWLLLTDADVRHQPDAVERGLKMAEETGAAAVSFSPDQEMKTWWERAVIPYVYCRLAREFPYHRASDPKDGLAAANGQWLLVRRDAYEAVGGHASARGEILEDVALARRLKRAGYAVHFSRGAGLARTRMYRHFREMWEGWSKNLFPLFGRRWSSVWAALAVALADVAAGLLLLTGAFTLLTNRALGLALLAPAGLFLAERLARYRRELHRNQYPSGCIRYGMVGSVLFAALLLRSAWLYRSGSPLRWKGREYAVPTK